MSVDIAIISIQKYIPQKKMHKHTLVSLYCGEERRQKWRAVEEEEVSTSGPLRRGLLTWGIAAVLLGKHLRFLRSADN